MVYDIIVIGGGINGAAVLREAAARDLRVLLLERADYGSGSTSRSSRLLHCGLRYLAPGGSMWRFVRQPGQLVRAIRTVKRSMRARNTLVRERPNLLRPIRMMFPIFEGDTYSGWQMDAAFTLLSSLGSADVPLDYRRYSPGRLGEELPFADMMPKDRRLKTVIAYTEYQIDWPERLTFDLISEARSLGAEAYNYTPVSDLSVSDGNWQVKTADGRSFTAHTVINLAGPWVDHVAGLAHAEGPRMVNTTRGAHISLQLPSRFKGHGVMMLSGLDHPFYCFPWRGNHFLGPTEAASREDPDACRPLPSEEEALLAECRRQLPGLSVTADQIKSGWAGLRPLTHEPSTMTAARNRVIHEMSLAGGSKLLSLTNGSLGAHAITANDLLARAGHGSAPRKAVAAAASPDDLETLTREGQVVHLEDLVWRRLGRIWDEDAGLQDLEETATTAASLLGWSRQQRDEEVEAYKKRCCELGLCKT